MPNDDWSPWEEVGLLDTQDRPEVGAVPEMAQQITERFSESDAHPPTVLARLVVLPRGLNPQTHQAFLRTQLG
jgi:hypothetical protein